MAAAAVVFVILLAAAAASAAEEECQLAGSLDRLTKAVALAGNSLVRQHSNDELALLKARVEALEARENVSGRAVFFSATSRRHLRCFDCVVDFTDVAADSHDALDATSGTFRAPVAGHYFFQFHGVADIGREVKVT